VKEHADVERLLERWAADDLAARDVASSGAANHLPDAKLLRLLATRPPDMTDDEAQQVLARLRSALRVTPDRNRLHLLRWAALVVCTCLVLLLTLYPQSWPHLNGPPASRVLVKTVSFHSVSEGRTVTFRLTVYKTQESAHALRRPPSSSP
jgi:hypothetical protein